MLSPFGPLLVEALDSADLVFMHDDYQKESQDGTAVDD
jgi:hypothetical protein